MWDALWTWMTPGMEAMLRLAPAFTLFLTIAGLIGAVATFRQKSQVDRAADWWNRVQAALDQAASPDAAVAGWSRSMLDYLCEPPLDILRLRTWRRRWRITRRDRVIIADLLTAIVERTIPVALPPAPVEDFAPAAGSITSVAIPGLPLQQGPDGVWHPATESQWDPDPEFQERELLAYDDGVDGEGPNEAGEPGDREDDAVDTETPREGGYGNQSPDGVRLGQPQPTGDAPEGIGVEDWWLAAPAQPAPASPVFTPTPPPEARGYGYGYAAQPFGVSQASTRAQAELIVRLNREASRPTPQAIADLAENGKGRPAG